jgi:hypothetical protein
MGEMIMRGRAVTVSLSMEKSLQRLFALLLLARLLYPFFNSPLQHLFSDPARHWENGERFLHPGLMGSGDPFLYQLWLYGLRWFAQGSAPMISLGCGILCAAMPYGWYRALRESQSRERALVCALIVGSIPESVSLYGYFMNETLLITLMGFCFWMTLRSNRKKTLTAYALAVIVWSCAVFTRTIVLPMAAACLLWLWSTQAQRLSKAFAAAGILIAFAIPAGLHSQAKLGFFAPLGNMYLNEIYSISGKREIDINFGPDGRYHFGCPSFYNPTFYPFWNWTTDRTGVVAISIDLNQGRAAWTAEKQRIAAQRTFPVWRQRLEDLVYAVFGQSWPNSDRSSLFGWLTVWTRWIWGPLIVVVAVALAARRYRGLGYLLPVCGLGTFVLLLLQTEGVMEARYREPIDALLICSLFLMSARPRSDRQQVINLAA